MHFSSSLNLVQEFPHAKSRQNFVCGLGSYRLNPAQTGKVYSLDIKVFVNMVRGLPRSFKSEV